MGIDQLSIMARLDGYNLGLWAWRRSVGFGWLMNNVALRI